MKYSTIDEVISDFTKLDLKYAELLYSEHKGFTPLAIDDDLQQKLCMCLALEISDDEICSLLNITQNEINQKISAIIGILNARTPVIKFLNIADERKKLQYHLTACKHRSCKISILDFSSVNKNLSPNYCYFHSIANLFHRLSSIIQNPRYSQALSQENDPGYNILVLAEDFLDQKELIKSAIDEHHNFSAQLFKVLQSNVHGSLNLKSIYYPLTSNNSNYYSFSNITSGAYLFLGHIKFYYVDKLTLLYNAMSKEQPPDKHFHSLISNEETKTKISFYNMVFTGGFSFDNSNCTATFSACKFDKKTYIRNSYHPDLRPLEVAIENHCGIRAILKFRQMLCR